MLSHHVIPRSLPAAIHLIPLNEVNNILVNMQILLICEPLTQITNKLFRIIQSTGMTPMDSKKHLFSLPDNHHYINGAYMSPMLKSVEEAGSLGIRKKQKPWNIKPETFFEESNHLRQLFANLIGAIKSNSIALMPAVSYGMATVARNIDPCQGSTIVLAGEQFPSNVYIWKRFCEKNHCQLEFVDAPEATANRGQRWNERILDTINQDTLLVALGNVHWADGTLFDLKTIGTRTRASGTYFVIDGTQSVGALPIDVKDVSADALICAGYKWLMGPYSIALGYFSERLSDGTPIEEGWLNRKGSENFSGLVNYAERYQPGAIRYDVGERSNFILVPMMAVALKQIIDWGPENIQQYCKKLTSDFTDQLQEQGYRIEKPGSRGHHLFGARLPENRNISAIKRQLEDHNIYVSIRGSAIRISPNVYNTKEDMNRLLSALTS